MKEKKLVVKSNFLIEAKADLTLQEQKILLYAISKLEKDDHNFYVMRFNIKEFTELIGSSGKRYQEFREIVRSLRRREVIIKTSADGETLEKELITGWLSSIELGYQSGDIELEFSSKLVPYLLNLKKYFTKYEIENVLKFQSRYSLKIYELLKQYENFQSRNFTLVELREILKIGKEEYKRFYNFETRILKIAVEEINQYSDIAVSYTKEKNGKEISLIKFQILKKNKNLQEPKKEKPRTEKENPSLSFLQTVMPELSCEDLIKLLKISDEKTILEKYFLAQNCNGKINNLMGFLITAIKEDYTRCSIPDDLEPKEKTMGPIEKRLQQKRFQKMQKNNK